MSGSAYNSTDQSLHSQADHARRIARREFLRAAGIGAAACASHVASSFNCPFLGLAHAADDAASRAVSAAIVLARKKSGVTLRILQPFLTNSSIKPAADEWRRETGIPVTHIESPLDGINFRIVQDAATKSGEFDVALAVTQGIADLAGSGAIVDLTELAKQHNPDRDAPGCRVLYTAGDFYQGRLYGLCADGDAYLMFYRKDLLESEAEQRRFADKHGFALGVPRTWSELDTMLRFFHRPHEGLYGGSLYRNLYATHEWIVRFTSKGRYLFDDNMSPQINGDGGVKALEELIAVSPYLHPAANAGSWPDITAAVASGRCFAHIGWGADQRIFWNPQKSKVRGKLAWGPTPGGLLKGKLVRTPSFNWGWSWVVPRESQAPELAYLFCQYLYSARISTIAVRDPDGILEPFRECHYSDPVVREVFGDGYLSVHRYSLSLSMPDFHIRGNFKYTDILGKNIEAANRRLTKPKQALDAVARAWNQITDQLGRDSQIAQWRFLKSQYPAHLRAVLS